MKMKKYAILMSHNNYLYSGLKSTLHDANIFLFHEDEIDKFLNLCSVTHEEEVIIFYDEQFSKITSVIFHDREYRLVNIAQLKDYVLDDLFEIPESKLLKTFPSNYKSKVMEKKAIYYYAFYNMGYRDIAQKMQISEARVSYFINNYVRGMKFRHKIDFFIKLESSRL